MAWRPSTVALWLVLGACQASERSPADAGHPGDLAQADADDAAAPALTDGPYAPVDLPSGPSDLTLASRKADILFVIDNSGSMAEEQNNLARNFPLFLDTLGSFTELDVHIGVVTTDLGAGASSSSPTCQTAPGDDGGLCRTKGVDRCSPCGVKGNYLTTMPSNFTDSARNTLGCLARPGITGCSFEHSLGSLHRALTSPANAGFVRPDAMLALVIITDEDDCTAPADSPLFAAVRPGQDASLRCALEGHRCQGARNDGSSDVDLPLAACEPATDGALVPVQQLVDAVIAVKGDPRSILATALVGWPFPGEEGRYRINAGAAAGSDRVLRPVCASTTNGSAGPGLRVKAFIESFPHNALFSICQDDFSEILHRIARTINFVAAR